MEQMQKTIEVKHDNIVRELVPKIEQLEEKMEASWNSIKAMDATALQELQNEKRIFEECEGIQKEMTGRINKVELRV